MLQSRMVPSGFSQEGCEMVGDMTPTLGCRQREVVVGTQVWCQLWVARASGMSSSELFRHHSGNGKPRGGFSCRLLECSVEEAPILACFGGEERSFPATKWGQDRVCCSLAGGLGRDISFHSPLSCCCSADHLNCHEKYTATRWSSGQELLTPYY